jgi:hypothetical protein
MNAVYIKINAVYININASTFIYREVLNGAFFKAKVQICVSMSVARGAFSTCCVSCVRVCHAFSVCASIHAFAHAIYTDRETEGHNILRRFTSHDIQSNKNTKNRDQKDTQFRPKNEVYLWKVARVACAEDVVRADLGIVLCKRRADDLEGIATRS